MILSNGWARMGFVFVHISVTAIFMLLHLRSNSTASFWHFLSFSLCLFPIDSQLNAKTRWCGAAMLCYETKDQLHTWHRILVRQKVKLNSQILDDKSSRNSVQVVTIRGYHHQDNFQFTQIQFSISSCTFLNMSNWLN